jgi:hypothetical protein
MGKGGSAAVASCVIICTLIAAGIAVGIVVGIVYAVKASKKHGKRGVVSTTRVPAVSTVKEWEINIERESIELR